MTRDVKREDWKITDLAETLKMLHDVHGKYLAPDIEEDKITTSEP